MKKKKISKTKKRTRKANKKVIEKMNRFADRLVEQSEKDIAEIQKTLIVDDFPYLEKDDSEYPENSSNYEDNPFDPYLDDMYDS